MRAPLKLRQGSKPRTLRFLFFLGVFLILVAAKVHRSDLRALQSLRWVLDCFGVRVLLRRKEVQGVIGGPKAGRREWTGTGEWQEGCLEGWCNVYLVASAAISSSSSCRRAQPKGTDVAHRSEGVSHTDMLRLTVSSCVSMTVFPSKLEIFLKLLQTTAAIWWFQFNLVVRKKKKKGHLQSFLRHIHWCVNIKWRFHD